MASEPAVAAGCRMPSVGGAEASVNDCGAGTHNLSLLLRRNPQPGANELAVSGLEGSCRSTPRCYDGRPRRLVPCSSQMTAPTHAPACRHTPLPSNKIKVPVSFYRLVFRNKRRWQSHPRKKLKGAISNFLVSVQSFWLIFASSKVSPCWPSESSQVLKSSMIWKKSVSVRPRRRYNLQQEQAQFVAICETELYL